MISSTFLPPSLHLTEKTEIFPEFLHIQFLSLFPFPEATPPQPVCPLVGLLFGSPFFPDPTRNGSRNSILHHQTM